MFVAAQSPIMSAFRLKQFDLIVELIHNPDTDLSSDGGRLLSEFSYLGDIRMVKLLLSVSDRINLKLHGSDAIANACASTYDTDRGIAKQTKMVKLFLNDKRFDPGFDNNWAFRRVIVK
jgi:hypothetical protein